MAATTGFDHSMLRSFQLALRSAKHVVVLTGLIDSMPTSTHTMQVVAGAPHNCNFASMHAGAGTSAESGIPTFRGAGGLWRKYEATALGEDVGTSV